MSTPQPPEWFRRARNWLWGYDFFISYHWESGGIYAVNLAQRLRDLRYEVFLDRTEYAMGEDWKEAGELALLSTQRLVLIATRKAVTESNPVEHEVEAFTRRRRHIIPIVFGDKFSDLEREEHPVLHRIKESQLYIDEEPARLSDQPSNPVVEQLVRTLGVMRKRNLRAFLTLVALCLVTAFAAFATVSWGNALLSRNAALAEARRAKSQRQATLGRILLNENPELSILHSVKSVFTTRNADGYVLPESEQILRDALNAQGGRRLSGHHGEINAVAISPDGRWIASGGADSTARIWEARADVPSRGTIPALPHSSAVQKVGFDPNGKRLVTADQQNACLWDLSAANPAASRRFLVRDTLRAIATSESGRWLVTADGKSLSLSDLGGSDGEPSPRRLVEGETFGNVAFSKDESRLAIDVADVIHVWDLRGELARIAINDASFVERRWNVDRVVLSADGQRLAATFIDGSAFLWDLASANSKPAFLAHPRPLKVRGQERYWIGGIAFSPDGRWLATSSSDCSARLWDLGDPAKPVVKVLKSGNDDNDDEYTPSKTSLAFTPNGKWLFVCGDELDETSAWPVTGEGPGELRDLPSAKTLAVSRDGRWLVTSAALTGVQAWEISGDGPWNDSAIPLAGTGGRTDLYAIDPGGRILVTAAGDSARVWELGEMIPRTKSPASPLLLRTDSVAGGLGMAVSNDQHWLAAAAADGFVRIIDLNGSSISPVPTRLKVMENIAQLGFHPDNRRLLIASGLGISMWDLSADFASPALTLRVPPSENPDERIHHFAVSPDGRILAAAHGPNTSLWDLSAKNPELMRSQLAAHPDRVEEIRFDASGRIMVTKARLWHNSTMWTAGSGISVHLLNLDSPKTSATIGIPAAEIHSFDLSPDGRWLVTTASDTTWLWDLKTAPLGNTRIELKENPRDIDDVVFSENGRWLITGKEYPNRLGPTDLKNESPIGSRLWNLLKPDKPIDLPGYITDSTSGRASAKGRQSPDGRWLATSGLDGRVYLWDLLARTPTPATLTGHANYVNEVAFDSKGRRMATADSVSLRVWDLDHRTPKLVMSVREPVHSIVVSPDGNTLVCTCLEANPNGDTRSYSRLWKLSSIDPASSAIDLPGGGYDSDRLGMITRNLRWYIQPDSLVVKMWPVGIDDVLELARGTVGRNFTRTELDRYYPGDSDRPPFPDLPVPP